MQNQKPKKNNSGFTLVELMVSVTVFTTIMTISMGSILGVFDANKKSQSLRTVMDNLNFTMESMTRVIRFGTNYHCDVSYTPITTPRDCANGDDSMAVVSSNGDQVVYRLNAGRITRSINGGSEYALTSDDMVITTLQFRVFGSPIYPDLYQPQVILVIGGYAGTKASTQSTFIIQTTISQRGFDFQ